MVSLAMHVYIGSEYMVMQNHTGRSDETCRIFNLIFLMEMGILIRIMMKMITFLKKKSKQLQKPVNAPCYFLGIYFSMLFTNMQLIVPSY